MSSLATAATYYVRTDGGDANQCTGRADAAYSGSGTGQACAWKHPFMALPPQGTPRIAGGDTLIVGSGSYMMGIGAPETQGCEAESSWDCHLSPVPSGPSPSRPTRILGKGHDAGCANPPELWGTERAGRVINLEDSSNVEVGCFEVTDHAACIEQHCHNGQCRGEIAACRRDAAPFGTWAGTGVYATDSRNVKLKDLNIHGLANRGVMAGRLTDWTLERVKIRANGWAGWDGDVGSNSSNAGTIAFKQVEISWNGCAERYPGTQTFGCWGQHAGGYGDGLGTGSTGGNWVIEDSWFHHNTSDGLDLLYMNGTGSVTVRRTYAEGNAGNQLKTSGNAVVENNVVVGNCTYFNGQGNMADGDHCRALGNALAVGLSHNAQATVRYNTITGEGDCLVISMGGTAGSRLKLANNALLGQLDWRQPWEQSCAHYNDGGQGTMTYAGNLMWRTKNNQCIAGSLCIDPGFVNATMAGFDPTPIATSPLVNRADASETIAHDWKMTPRPSGGAYDVGAVEVAGAGGNPIPPGPNPNPIVFLNGFD